MSRHYQPCYCEENIYHLLAEPAFEAGESFALFVSNPRQSCALWWQRAAPAEGIPVCWDYHVVGLKRLVAGDWRVWDLDTTLDLPMAATAYLDATFQALPDDLSYLRPRFRLVARDVYRAEFSSDRAHMRNPSGGWIEPPPTWPAIVREGPAFWRWVLMPERGEDSLGVAELKLAFRS